MIEPIARILIELRDPQPRIWRCADVPASSTLIALHDIIQVAMGWSDAHLFEFRIGDKVYGEPDPDDILYERKVYRAKGLRLKSLIDRGVDRFEYICGFLQ